MINEQRIVVILKTTIIVTALLLIIPLFIPGKYIFVKLFSEDGFYSLTVAKNIAQGNGMTIDGTMFANGFQPLFTLICVIPFFLAGGDLNFAFQLLYAINLVIFFVTAWVIAACIRHSYLGQKKEGIFWITIFLYLSSIYLLEHHMNALETGLLMFFYALIWRYLQTKFNNTIQSSIILGVLFGLLVLTRIDAGFFCASFALLHIWNHRSQNLLHGILQMAITATTAFIISSPWWVYNIWMFGSVMPTSGIAEQKIAISVWRTIEVLLATLQDLIPHIHGGRYSKQTFDLVRIILFSIGLGIVVKNYKKEIVDDTKFFVPLIYTIILLAFWYSFTSYATYFYGRYLLPIVFLSVFFLARIILETKKTLWKLILLIVSIAPLFVFLSIAYTRQTYESLEQFYRITNPKLRLLESKVPANEKIGSGQTGFLGFIRKGVVNLDGKVNVEALVYKDSIWAYMDKEGIRWFCDDAESMNRCGFNDLPKHGWKLKFYDIDALLYRKSDD